MKQLFYFSSIFLLINCSKKNTENTETQNYLSKNYFILSRYDKYFDSIKNVNSKIDSLKVLNIEDDKNFNKNYSMGAIHFLVIDQNKSYYIVNDLSPFLKNW